MYNVFKISYGGIMDKELIERAKRADISVLNLRLKSEGKTLRCMENDSLVFAVGREGFWVFAWNSRSIKGDLIDFVMNYRNMTFCEAVEFLTGETVQTVSKDAIKKFTKVTELQMPQRSSNMHRAIAYLTKTRYIKQATIQYLIDKKLIYQDVRGNVVFPWRLEGKEIGAELNGTLSDKRFKGIAPGSKFGYGFNITSGTPDRLYFFESAIDLLSFTNLYKCSNCVLVSMAGLKQEVIHTYIKMYPKAEVVMCIDNDDAADKFIKANEFDKYKRITPKSKDFNEDLKNNIINS
jgi:hypothetical protein